MRMGNKMKMSEKFIPRNKPHYARYSMRRQDMAISCLFYPCT